MSRSLYLSEERLVFRTEQDMLPPHKRVCTVCRGRGEVPEYPNKPLVEGRQGYMMCPACSGSGKRVDERERWYCKYCDDEFITYLQHMSHERTCWLRPYYEYEETEEEGDEETSS